jgi:hypothetical protein
MPWHLLNHYLNAGHSKVEQLAAIFQVSPSAMFIRLGVPFEQV